MFRIVGVLFGLTDYAYWLYVTDLGVDRDYEGQGIGRRLMKTAHELAGGEKDIAVYLIANDKDLLLLPVLPLIQIIQRLLHLHQLRLALTRKRKLPRCIPAEHKPPAVQYEQEIRQERRGGSGNSQLTVPKWLQKIKKLFPKQTVEIMERHALDRLSRATNCSVSCAR